MERLSYHEVISAGLLYNKNEVHVTYNYCLKRLGLFTTRPLRVVVFFGSSVCRLPTKGTLFLELDCSAPEFIWLLTSSQCALPRKSLTAPDSSCGISNG